MGYRVVREEARAHLMDLRYWVGTKLAKYLTYQFVARVDSRYLQLLRSDIFPLTPPRLILPHSALESCSISSHCGLLPNEQTLILCLARYARTSHPRINHLTSEHLVSILRSILRVTFDLITRRSKPPTQIQPMLQQHALPTGCGASLWGWDS